MKKSFLLVFLFNCSLFSWGQNQVKLTSCQKIETSYSDADSARIYLLDGFDNIKIVAYSRPNEYFVIEDTLHRDFIIIENKIYILDKIMGMRSMNYTVNFDLIECFLINHNGSDYIIIAGGDTFPVGTNQQVDFFIFKKRDSDWILISSYENLHDSPIYDIRAIKKRNTLHLKGPYLKQLN